MLTIQKRTTLKDNTILAVNITILIFVVWTWGIVFHHFDTRNMCLNVAMVDYVNKSAPAKCMVLWNEGKL